MNSIQKKLVEMLEWLSNYLKSHNLRYWVLYGTMLGASRHKGFIPWDDDVDIGMPRSDYEQLVTLLKNPEDNYIVETFKNGRKDFMFNFAKLYDTRTTLIETNGRTRGVYIDIFPVDGAGHSLAEASKHIRKITMFDKLLSIKSYPVGSTVWWKKAVCLLLKCLPVSKKQIVMKIEKLCCRYDFETCPLVGVLLNPHEIINKNVFGTPVLYPFENIMVYGVEKFDEYLTKIYGEWRKLPPVEQRRGSHYLFCDLQHSYLMANFDM